MDIAQEIKSAVKSNFSLNGWFCCVFAYFKLLDESSWPLQNPNSDYFRKGLLLASKKQHKNDAKIGN